MTERMIAETGHSFGPAPHLGLVYAGVRVVLECGHIKRWDGWYPVPIPMPGETIECPECPHE